MINPLDVRAPYVQTLVGRATTYQRPAVDAQSATGHLRNAQMPAAQGAKSVLRIQSEENYAKALPPERIKEFDAY